MVGGPRFYERREIRDVLAYLRVIAQPNDDPAFERIINVPKRGIGKATVQMLHKVARDRGMSMFMTAMALAETDDLPTRAKSSITSLLEDFARWREERDKRPHTELAKLVMEESGYTAMWQNEKGADAPGRLENLKELVQAMAEFEDLSGFLEHISLVMSTESTDSNEKFSIMTLHSAKGLEFDTVFLAGWEEGVFPNALALDESGLAGLEEERRLAYVGITRAKRKAHILYASERQIFGQWQSQIPSRFIDELPKEHVNFSSDIAVSAAAGGGVQTSYGRGGGGGNWQPRGRNRVVEGSARRITVRNEVSDFAVGERVFHEKFGYGTVEDVEGRKLSVKFETSGVKKIMDDFVRRS